MMNASRGQELANRTKQFALRIIKLVAAIPRTLEGQTFGKQILRSGTSVGAHYREAMRARSNAEFISKIEGALQELEETGYWMELLVEAGIVPARRMESLQDERRQITAILVSSVRTVKLRKQRKKE
jgi:four helix bundle protein